MKKLLLGVLCLCSVGCAWGMKEEVVVIKEPKKEKQEKEKKQQDILEEWGVAPDARFFVVFRDEKIAISRAAVKRCSFLLDLVENSVEDGRLEYSLPLYLTKIGPNSSVEITPELLKKFITMVENSPNYMTSRDLCVFINLANYVQGATLPDGYKLDRDVLQELVEELKTRLKRVHDTNYAEFLSHKGLLWDVVQLVPEAVLENAHCADLLREPDWSIKGDFSQSLSDGRLVVNVARGNDEYAEVWKINAQQADWSVKGYFRQSLSDGRLVVVVNRGKDFYTEVWKIDSTQADWSVKGIFDHILPDGRLVVQYDRRGHWYNLHSHLYRDVSQIGSKQVDLSVDGDVKRALSDGRLVVDVGYGNATYTEVWSKRARKADWSIKGYFKEVLSDGRLVVDVARDNDFYTEVWKINAQQADWSVKGYFRKVLSDGRLVINVGHSKDEYAAVWKIDAQQAEWSVKGSFSQLLSDGRLVLGVWRGDDMYTEVWSQGAQQADWSIKGYFSKALSDGRLVVDVAHDKAMYTEVWSKGALQADLSIKGCSFRQSLSDGRLVVSVYRVKDTHPEGWIERFGKRYKNKYTEVWSKGAQQADLSINGDFEAELPDGRVVVRVKRDNDKDYTEVWNLKNTFEQQVLSNAINRIVKILQSEQTVESLTSLQEKVKDIKEALKKLNLPEEEFTKDKRWQEMELTILRIQERMIERKIAGIITRLGERQSPESLNVLKSDTETINKELNKLDSPGKNQLLNRLQKIKDEIELTILRVQEQLLQEQQKK